MREVIVKLDGTSAGAMVASGFSESSIESVTYNGVGDYTVTLKRPFNSDHPVLPDAFIQELTADRKAHVSAISASVLNILVTDLAAAPAESDLSIRMIGCDGRLAY